MSGWYEYLPEKFRPPKDIAGQQVWKNGVAAEAWLHDEERKKWNPRVAEIIDVMEELATQRPGMSAGAILATVSLIYCGVLDDESKDAIRANLGSIDEEFIELIRKGS